MHTSNLSISNSFLSWLILLVVALVLVEIQRIRDGCPPILVVEHKLVAEVLKYNC